MSDAIWQMLLIDGVANWLIYVAVILPKVREKRAINLRDRGFWAGNPVKTLMEYKEICEEDNESTLWFQIQICLIFVFMLFCFFGIIGQ
ncbi:MAG: hypothetical protein C4518_16915 [Desulfobacteraceae bacterium]|nr:MAG: hypothetical protein C4518_16915 [Desulfobacteraceae bacterium]